MLLWQNQAAALFLAKLKKHGLKLAPPAVPIKGQVARNIRLGSPGRSSLARIQFQAGEKPTSSTCATTPLVWQDDQIVLLIVGVDPIDADILVAAEAARADTGAPDTDDAIAPLVEANAPSHVQDGSTPEDDAAGPDVAAWDGEDDHSVAEIEAPAETPPLSEDALFHADEHAYARELDSWRSAEQHSLPVLSLVRDTRGEDLPGATDDASPAQADPVVAPASAAPVNAEDEDGPRRSRLSQLVDQLAADEALYAPLTDADDAVLGQGPQAPDDDQTPATNDEASSQDLPSQDPADAQPASQAPGTLFKVTGRGFAADAMTLPGRGTPVEETEAEADLAELGLLDAPGEAAMNSDQDAATDDTGDRFDHAADQLSAALAEIATPPSVDPDSVERVSRYNFDELSRILTDRVGDAGQPTPPQMDSNQRSAALVSLGGETLVLNRLPLGILVFRDQQVLFANRAITEMVGYESVESLRQAGLAAVFPAAGPEEQSAGPVNHLVQRDGTLVPVTARLQSISWHGRPALMLSASATEVRTGHEGAVNAFAQALADVRGDGFFEATRTGVISSITVQASSLLGQDGPVEGKPLTSLIASSDIVVLREFLDRPARFAETARPWLRLQAVSGRSEITLFAQGQAGVVTGYFGFVRGREAAPARLAGPTDADPALLARISRGVRRPLNTIIGFAELIGSGNGTPDTSQLRGYARDISAAGQDIAALVDELEDYARLRDGRYLPQRASIDLTEMLENCILRIRQQASNARVFVRNAISETLPRLTADRASLEQAVLNLLASAIDQSPNGGAVVISAQREDDGGIAVHVRDSSVNAVDMAERFVVFRDGPGRDGKMLAPVRSSVGLALTRSLLAVNAFSLSVDPAGEKGMLFTLKIPTDLVEKVRTSDVAE
ncbi:MAG: histidine kinase dimerization/phospho-acceptor domain-containing protein [Devosia sp.]